MSIREAFLRGLRKPVEPSEEEISKKREADLVAEAEAAALRKKKSREPVPLEELTARPPRLAPPKETAR